MTLMLFQTYKTFSFLLISQILKYKSTIIKYIEYNNIIAKINFLYFIFKIILYKIFQICHYKM